MASGGRLVGRKPPFSKKMMSAPMIPQAKRTAVERSTSLRGAEGALAISASTRSFTPGDNVMNRLLRV